MFKIPITTKADLIEAAKLQRRQQFENERKKRIFDAKKRTIGIDVDGLAQQKAEREQIRQLEAELERRYALQTEAHRQVVHAKTLEEAEQQRVNAAALNYYRSHFQRKEARREFELNDPAIIRKSLPTRCCDDDPRLGISSAQIFEGEDLDSKQRQQLQRAQQRAWLDQQIRERREAEEARAQANQMQEESIQAREQRILEMAQAERKQREELAQRLHEYNTQLAHVKEKAREQARQEEEEDNLAEIYNMLASDILRENPNVAQSCVDPHRKIPFEYRGMSAEDREKYREEQEKQRKEKEYVKGVEKMHNQQWEQYALNLDRELLLQDYEMMAKRKEIIEEQKRDNEILAVRQKIQKEYSDMEAVNEITPEFLGQFNTTTR